MATKLKPRPYPKGKAGTFDISIEGLEKMESRLRRQGRTDEADELAADIAARRSMESQPDQDDVDLSQLGTRGVDITPRDAPATGGKPSAAPEVRAKRRDRKQLDNTILMNGNMSVRRRNDVVVPALTRLGYTQEQARRIALASPLNTSMYDRQAVITSLRYGASVTPEAINRLPPDSVERSLAQSPIPMPPPAQRALRSAAFQENPRRGVADTLSRTGSTLGKRFAAWWGPISDRIGEQPVPTGLGGLFLVNLLFLAVIVPANAQGASRMQLLFATLAGRTQWANGAGVPQKPQVPASPLIASIAGIALSGEEIAQSIANLTGGAGQVAKVVGGIAPGVAHAVIGAAGATVPPIEWIGGILGIGDAAPAVNTSALPPRPPVTAL